MSEGLVYVFTGNGKGKTSAALGVAMRAVGAGMKVGWVAWYKEASWKISEMELPGMLKTDLFEMYLMGEGFHITQSSKLKAQNHNSRVKISRTGVTTAPVGGEGQVVVDRASEEDHVRAAAAALEKAGELLGVTPSPPSPKATEGRGNSPLKQGGEPVDVLVLDEVNNAVEDGLITLIDLIDLISKRGKTHVILTGRDVQDEVVEVVDLVTEMKKVKHPYDEGKLAVKGLDY